MRSGVGGCESQVTSDLWREAAGVETVTSRLHAATHTHSLTHTHTNTLTNTHKQTHTHSHSHTLNFHLRLYSRSLAQFSCFSQSESVCAFTRLHHCVFEPEQVCLRFHQRCINVENQQRWSDKMARGVMTHSHQALWDTHTWQSDTHLCWRIHYSHHETAFLLLFCDGFPGCRFQGFFLELIFTHYLIGQPKVQTLKFKIDAFKM